MSPWTHLCRRSAHAPTTRLIKCARRLATHANIKARQPSRVIGARAAQRHRADGARQYPVSVSTRVR
eukprot:scaffold229337_cov33-Tisochrysis_lutea.AAC.4